MSSLCHTYTASMLIYNKTNLTRQTAKVQHLMLQEVEGGYLKLPVSPDISPVTLPKHIQPFRLKRVTSLLQKRFLPPPIMAASLRGKEWAFKSIFFYCNNSTAVYCIGQMQDKYLMEFLRRLVFRLQLFYK